MTGEWSPYPGLRPFQPDDSEYFYGRDQQVDEIVERLRSKRFVAVIGGSGSGKSSLVLAGAIARLRSFAIKDAGDFWAPVIATPGTNHVGSDSPIRRLARKFCAELVAVEQPAARLDACVEALRRPNGLGHMVERFGGQLKRSDNVSLDGVQVNFLFLIDQFEELFHPSNVREPIATDCKHLVDRIVEQFKQPHRQICIAITMRSEHLNDCPRYEALPDAINAASYLVKRLDAAQLTDAIEQPVLRYLRKHVAAERAARRQARLEGRGVAPSAPVPDEIPIDARLIARLVADSNAVLAQQDHADHLPLLQHLLFWIWHESSERPDNAAMVDEITLDDLWRAVGAAPGAAIDAQVQPLEPSVNTLQACLERRCEALFASQVGEQAAWEAVFRSLAFKEPNTGSYTQQRAAMADLRARLGISSAGAGGDGSDDSRANAALAAHLRPWLVPHGYLHWDADSRTVKVAHETLIRRWERLRHWIDEEDRQFHVYLRLLEDCERWVRAPDPADALSGGDTLRRYEDAKLPTALQDPAWLARIGRLLAMDRDGPRLAEVAGQALPFLTRSLDCRAERERKRHEAEERQRLDDVQLAEAGRLRWRFSLAIVLFIFLLPLTGWVLVLARAEHHLAEKERTLHRSYALAAESQAALQPQFDSLDGPQQPLRYALVGAHYYAEGFQMTARQAQWPLLNTYYGDRLEALGNAERLSEAGNTNSLRTILQGGVWRLPAGPSAAASAPGVPPDATATAAEAGHLPAQPCSSLELAADHSGLPGKVGTFYPRSGSGERAGLLVIEAAPDTPQPSAVKSINVGRLGAYGRCLVGQQLFATPQLLSARIGVSENAADFVVGFGQKPTPDAAPGKPEGGAQGYAYTQFYSVLWGAADAEPGGGAGLGGAPSVTSRPRATVTAYVDFAEGQLRSHSSRFWNDVQLGDTTVRLFEADPSLRGDGFVRGARAFTPLTSASVARGESACARLARDHAIDLGIESAWELNLPADDSRRRARSYCVRVHSSTNVAGSTVNLAALYRRDADARDADKDRDLPLVSLVPVGALRPSEFRLDEAAGWLAFRSGVDRWRAVPWGLDAFTAMAGSVFQPRPLPAPGEPARHGCSRAKEEPQFHLTFNLIMGTEPCPTDAALQRWAASFDVPAQPRSTRRMSSP